MSIVYLSVDITCPEIVECVTTHLRHPDVRVRNVATIFLETCCTKKQIADSKRKVDAKLGKAESQGQGSEEIPLS